MSKTIHAVFENGVFRPTGPVDLPESCEVEFEPRTVNPITKPPGEEVAAPPGRRLTWDEIFATKLVVNSAPPDQNEDDVEVTGDDFLF
jgi:predicted DNA-binding antitoxin AbrB/MazE fold protein